MINNGKYEWEWYVDGEEEKEEVEAKKINSII